MTGGNTALSAAVAELADAQASGACVLRDVEVRVLSAAVLTLFSSENARLRLSLMPLSVWPRHGVYGDVPSGQVCRHQLGPSHHRTHLDARLLGRSLEGIVVDRNVGSVLPPTPER